MSKRNIPPPSPPTSILARVFANGWEEMSPTFARKVLKLGFNQADQERMADLAERNQNNALTPDELAELMEFVDAGHVLSILHSQARLSLKRVGKMKA